MSENINSALSYLTSKHYDPLDMMDAFHDEVKAALRFTDAALNGEVSEGVRDEDYLFKAMAQELMKEIEDE